MPERIQLSRRKGWRKPENTVLVSRPGPWGNPYRIVRAGKTTWQVTHGSWLCEEFISRTGSEARADAVRRLQVMLDNDRAPWTRDMIRRELAGKNLACWCPLDQPCHADVLLKLANQEETMTAHIGPDCRDGKHPACDGRAWNNETDQPADCGCTCHKENS